MLVDSLIHCIEQFLLTGLISLTIVFATIRAYFAKLLTSMEEAGFSPLFIISLLSILSIYGCIATIRCCAWCQQVSADEESAEAAPFVTDSRFKSPIFLDWRWDGQRLRFYGRRQGAIKLNEEPSGESLFFPSFQSFID